MTRSHSSRYARPADPYKQYRCPDCKHIRYAGERAGDPCRWCGDACPNHATPLERAERGDGAVPGQHYLIVHECLDDGMDIEHPESCPTESIYDGRVKVRTCLVGEMEIQFGLDEYFHRAGTQGEGEPTSVGRHLVEYWTNGADDDRFDCGLRLVGGGDGAA